MVSTAVGCRDGVENENRQEGKKTKKEQKCPSETEYLIFIKGWDMGLVIFLQSSLYKIEGLWWHIQILGPEKYPLSATLETQLGAPLFWGAWYFVMVDRHQQRPKTFACMHRMWQISIGRCGEGWQVLISGFDATVDAIQGGQQQINENKMN